MKTRNGFVSNSSSSSFLVIETSDIKIYKVLDKLNIKEPWGYEEIEEAGYSARGYGEMTQLNEVLGLVDDPYGGPKLGMNIEKYLKEGLTLQQCQEKLSNHIKEKHNVNIPPDKFRLNFGERSSE